MQALVFGVTNPLFPAAFYLTQGGDGGQFLPQAPGTVLGAGAQACLGLRTPARWCCCRPNCSSTTPALGQEHSGCEATKSSSINPGHPMVSTLLGRGVWQGWDSPLHHPDARYNGRPVVGLKMYQRTYASVTKVACACR